MEYYSDIFTDKTWAAFLVSGAHITAFSASQRTAAHALSPGDRLLCYVRRRFVWVGALEVRSNHFESSEPIWSTAEFPVRFAVEPIVAVAATRGIHIDDFSGKLSFLPTARAANWGSHLQGSPRRMSQADGDVIWRALTSISSDENAQGTAEVVEPDSPSPGHFGVQATLAKFGLATGCEVWVPKNDRQRVTRAAPEIADSRLLGRLPIAFGGIAEETIANIDVLWFKGRRIVAAFEVEHSTSIYSGLLRMADLASVFPNLPFPLYVVAPDDRRAAVRAEITRPVFDRLSPPLSEVARFIGYQRLADLIAANPPESHAYLDPAVIAMASEAFGQ